MVGDRDTTTGAGDASERPPAAPADAELRQDDDGGMYGVFGEGRPRRIVGDSDEPPRRRPRRKPTAGGTGTPA